MTRIRKLEPHQWDSELAEMTSAGEAPPIEQGLMRIFAHRPELAKGFLGFAGALKGKRTLPDRLVELVRLRVAFHNQCRSCMAIRYEDAVADGVDEDLVCSLEKPMEAENLSAAEKIAIRYGELMATNHLAIDDGVYDELSRYYSEEEIVELGMTVALFVGFGRLAATWHMVEELPPEFQAASSDTISPWGNEKIVVR